MEFKNLAFEVKATSEPSETAPGGEFEGLAAAFHNIDDSYFGDIIAPGAFGRDLPEFLASGFVAGMNHDWDAPIGRPVAARETPEGLYVRAALSDTGRARETRTLMRDGVIRRLSIGFKTLGRRFLESVEEVERHWESVGYQPSGEDREKAAARGGARLLTRLWLYEISPVALAANSRAVVMGVKEGQGSAFSVQGSDGSIGSNSAARRASVSFEDHFAAVHATLAEFIERARALGELRARDGRALSPERLRQLRDVRDAVDALLRLEPRARMQEVARLLARFEATAARARGIEV